MLLILTCAWHRRYTGRRRFLGVARWWPPFPIRVSHGICLECKTRLREEWRAMRERVR